MSRGASGLAFVAALHLAALHLAALGAAQDRPNIVFVLTDDQRHDALGCAGHPFLQTPHMDAIAARGERFTNCFVTTAICAASRASILTGAWEGTHGYTFGKPPLAESLIENSWPRLLRGAGYYTGFVGKWGVKEPRGSRQTMWDSFRAMSAPYLRRNDAGGVVHQTDAAAQHAVEFLRAAPSDRPFCLMLSFNAPHAHDSNEQQYVPPPALAGVYDDAEVPMPPLCEPEFFASLPAFQRESLNRVRWFWRFDTEEKRVRMTRNYCAMITGVDRALGRVLDELHALGRADDTVVVFTSDNGYFLGERGFAGKWTIHEVSVRVPLLVHDPRRPRLEAAELDPIVLNVDVPSTLLDLASVEVPASYQGRSLLPFLRGETPKWRDDFFYEHRMNHAKIPKSEGVRGSRWVYVRYYEQEPVFEELYDLAADPHQRTNLAADPAHAATLRAMRQRCNELRARYVSE